MEFSTLLQHAPAMTLWVAVIALVGALLLLLYGAWGCYRWLRDARALRAVGVALVQNKDLRTKKHAELFADENILTQIKGVAKATERSGAAVPLIEKLGPQVRPSYDPQVIGAGPSWPEVSRRYLAERRWPLRLMRAAAGWVVLLGLAGTVLGFIEALPRMRDAFSSAAQAQAAVSRGQGPPQSEEETAPAGRGTSAAGEMIGVLGDLGGVFLATLTGVVAALVLYTSAAGFERAFDRLAHEVEVFGRRWLLPLSQPPYTQLDQAVKNELGEYFQALSGQFSGLMQPVVQKLADTLGEVVKMSQDFAGNIEKGRDTLETFQGAVQTLGTSAEEAVRHLSQVIEPSQKFLEDIERLQREGENSFAEAIGKMEAPVATLAASAQAVETRVEKVGEIAKMLDTSVGRVDETLTSQKESLESLRQDLGELSSALGEQGRAVSDLAEAVGGAAAARAPLEAALREVQEQLPQIRTQLEGFEAGLRPEAALPLALAALQERLAQGFDTRDDEIVAALEQLGDRLVPSLEALQRELSEGRTHNETELHRLAAELTTALEGLGDRPAPGLEGLREELVALCRQHAGGAAEVEAGPGTVEELRAGEEALRESIQELGDVIQQMRAPPPGAPAADTGEPRSEQLISTPSFEALLADHLEVLRKVDRHLIKMTSKASGTFGQDGLQEDENLAGNDRKTLRQLHSSFWGRFRARLTRSDGFMTQSLRPGSPPWLPWSNPSSPVGVRGAGSSRRAFWGGKRQ